MEFSADRVVGSQVRRNRWYGVVVAMTTVAIHFEEADDGPAAVMLSKSKRVDPAAFAQSILKQREELLARAERLRKKAEALMAGKI